MDSTASFYWRRLHSLSGVVPIGLFILVHLFNNAYAFLGAEAYDAHLEWARRLPFMGLCEWLFIYMPILFHGGLGLAMTFQGQARFRGTPYLGNLRYVLQRASGVGVFLFVGAHVYNTRVGPWLRGKPVDFAHMAQSFSEPLTFWVYMAGMLAVAYHFGNGLWTFCITWGITVNPRSQRVMTGVAIVVFLLLWALLANTVLGFLGHGLPMAG